ncbi:hypothetical protein GM921_09675 [Pedobacter sp. LMG 31464]|uniref:Uncharacterized protein n=1 Tax=Pedobacter planticolens TaxID=2679964 RepID=A0A923IUC2_9SPHI|nr:hypothetical protein [Pedobacter planticolens]MBB2145755.1 hypothetical protein [Pedobacter planticolens]
MTQTQTFSIQSIFSAIGQYDRYAIFNFLRGSAAFETYGGTVYGYIIYLPSERARLKQEMEAGNTSSDDGTIFLDGALQDKEKNQRLLTKGFLSTDIASINIMDLGPIKNQYDETNVKEIPNTINIDFHPEFLSGEKMLLHVFRLKLKEGIPLIPDEVRRYYGLQLLLEPEQVTDENKVNILTDPATGKYYDDVLITILSSFVEADREGSPFRYALNNALSNRRKTRVAYICRHLGIALKHIDKLRIENIGAWQELMTLVYRFEPETLTCWGWTHHVYWDFERFIHIYLRHYKKFLINESSKGQGTGFLYTIKNIRRIINIVLDANKVAIEERLKAGKGFHLQNDKGHYFNGNYYSIKIDPDGRLMQFHPQDNA